MTPHWHHTVPRSLGGEDSLQIPLDADCHNTLHHKASAIVAQFRGGKKTKIGQFWPSVDSERRAEQWLQILVSSMLFPPDTASGDKQTLLPMIKVGPQVRQGLDLLKKDLPGITNIEQTLFYCVMFTLQSKGYYNNVNETKSPDNKRRNPSKRDNLW
jgi:hypothetical protein